MWWLVVIAVLVLLAMLVVGIFAAGSGVPKSDPRSGSNFIDWML